MEPLPIRVDDLLLRSWRPTDAETIVRARADAAISRWSRGSPVPFRIGDARDFLVAAQHALNDGTVVGGAITDARTGELLGAAALHSIDKESRTGALGYWSAPWARGRRVTERAARALLTWGLTERGLARVDWFAEVGNHASRLIALRLGFTIAGFVPAELRRRDHARIDEWRGWVLPGQVTAPDFEVPEAVRKTARAFGAGHPVLAGGAVRLRRPVAADVPGVAAAHRDPESARWFGVEQPFTDDQAASYVNEHVPTLWARGQEAVFAVAGPGDAYAGSIDLQISPTDPAAGEIGCLIAPHARGRGFATAALQAISGWGFAELGLRRIVWRAEVGNDASRRVAERAGFVFEGVQRAGLQRRGSRPDLWVAARTAPGPDET